MFSIERKEVADSNNNKSWNRLSVAIRLIQHQAVSEVETLFYNAMMQCYVEHVRS